MAKSRKSPRKRRSGPMRKRARSGSGSIGFAIAGAILSVVVYLAFGSDLPILTGPSAPAPTSPSVPGPDAPIPTATSTGKKGDRIVGQASVIDGDTLDIHGIRIRLSGVDAPESGQKCRDARGAFVRCGANAANALSGWINRNPVSCTVVDTDRYGRSVAECSVRDEDVQDWLARNGHALAYRQYSTQYVAAEDAARAARAGVWAGEFVPPAEWRKGVRLSGEAPTKAMTDGKVVQQPDGA